MKVEEQKFKEDGPTASQKEDHSLPLAVAHISKD
jgi:hypothetical protein